jgi:hypothetical protein
VAAGHETLAGHVIPHVAPPAADYVAAAVGCETVAAAAGFVGAAVGGSDEASAAAAAEVGVVASPLAYWSHIWSISWNGSS